VSPPRKLCSYCGQEERRLRGMLFPGEAAIARAIMAYRAPNGTCLVSITQVALYVGKQRGPVRNAIARLVEKGYFDVVSVGSASGGPSRYRPTERMKA
jgi:hypothetical protein